MNDSPLSNPGAFMVRPAAPAPVETTTTHEPTSTSLSDRFEGVPSHIAAYEQGHGRPYVVDLLDILPVYQQLGMEGSVKNVDRYILNQITSRNLQPTSNVYEELFTELKENLGLDPRLNFDEVLERVDAYCTMMTQFEQKKLLKQVLGLG